MLFTRRKPIEIVELKFYVLISSARISMVTAAAAAAAVAVALLFCIFRWAVVFYRRPKTIKWNLSNEQILFRFSYLISILNGLFALHTFKRMRNSEHCILLDSYVTFGSVQLWRRFWMIAVCISFVYVGAGESFWQCHRCFQVVLCIVEVNPFYCVGSHSVSAVQTTLKWQWRCERMCACL